MVADAPWDLPWTLQYNADDDGIWLLHKKCGGGTNLGFWPTPEEVLTAKQEHEDQPC